MESCVTKEPYYRRLVDEFVDRIRGMPDLPPHTMGIDFATAIDAFQHDWRNHFAAAGPAVAQPRPETPVRPQALSSVVAFYVTNRQFAADPMKVEFAGQVIAEPLPGASTPTDPGLAALLADVREAGVKKGLTVFHVAADPVLPASSEVLLEHLVSLSSARILTALIIDPDIWPGRGNPADAAAAVEQIISSPRWTGLVLVPTMDARAIVVPRGLLSRLIVLPQASEARVGALRSAFVDTRGRVLRASNEPKPGAERVPMLSGVGGKGA